MYLPVPILLSSLAFATVLTAQEREVTTTKLGTGTVSIDYNPTELKGRSPDKDLPVGELFRMSANQAAQLTTDVPLLFGGTVVAPGKHRLSARHDGKGKWEVLAFQGEPFHDPAVPHVVLPVKFAEEKDSMEALTLAASTDSKSSEQGAIKLHWGKFSLSLAPRALTTTKVESTLGGKPATFAFYGVPSTRETHRCIQRGDMLRVGTATQGGKDGVTFGIYGKRVDMQSTNVNLVFVNEALECGKGAIAANTKTIEMMKGFMADAPAEHQKSMQGFMDAMSKEIEATKSAIAAAEKLPAKVEIEGEVQTGQKAAGNLVVASEKAEGAVVVKLQLGQGAATFKVTDASFQK